MGGAVDRPDDGDRATDKSSDHALEQQMLVLPGLVGHVVALLEVAAGAKRPLPRAGHDDAALISGRRIDALEEGKKIAPHLRVHGIGHLGAIEGQQKQPLAAVVDPHRLVLAIHSNASALRCSRRTIVLRDGLAEISFPAMSDQPAIRPLSGRRIALPETPELDRLPPMFEDQSTQKLRCPRAAIRDAPATAPVPNSLVRL